ncbi:DcrB-related protein [Chitinilyticum litopenaei]|uniref:DcrB-related protein n=1 Tax=Chitinilyticum litopenaei TaxID=1121276 RepID=UPI0006880C57|nr:DUF1795 domain-containing protein [Chitinilyticum litopenaei]
MSNYRINEGQFTLPEGFYDNSANVFTLGTPQSATLNITITRDRLDSGEDLPSYVERQISKMSSHIKGYKLLDRQAIAIGADQLPGELLKATLPGKIKGSLLHQQQAGLAFLEGPHAGKVLVFTFTSQHKPSDAEQAQWQALLASYTPTV